MEVIFYQVQAGIAYKGMLHVIPDSQIFRFYTNAIKHAPEFKNQLKKAFTGGEEIDIQVKPVYLMD